MTGCWPLKLATLTVPFHVRRLNNIKLFYFARS